MLLVVRLVNCHVIGCITRNSWLVRFNPSIVTNSSFQNYTHPDDHTTQTTLNVYWHVHGQSKKSCFLLAILRWNSKNKVIQVVNSVWRFYQMSFFYSLKKRIVWSKKCYLFAKENSCWIRSQTQFVLKYSFNILQHWHGSIIDSY